MTNSLDITDVFSFHNIRLEHETTPQEIKEHIDDMKTAQERDINHFRKFWPTI